MSKRAAGLVYFERWLDPVAETILSGRPEIELVRLSYGDPLAETEARIRLAYGYQISPRTELLGPWFGDRDLLAKCGNLLAISSSGAGYDMVDVDVTVESSTPARLVGSTCGGAPLAAQR